MHVIKTLRWYPVVDLIGWMSFTIIRTIQFIQYVEEKRVLGFPTWLYDIFRGLVISMGLGRAVIFFCNQKVIKQNIKGIYF